MGMLFGTLVFVCLLSSVCSVSPAPHPADECSMSSKQRSFRLITTCNSTTLKKKQLVEIRSSTTTLYLPVLYVLAFIVGLPSNLLALWVLVFRTKRLPSTTLLINLTVADCLLLLVLPFRIVYHFRGNNWELGEPFCRVVMAVFYGNMYGSVLCLAFVALDRYMALVHPFAAKTLRSQRTAVCMAAVVWVVVLAAMLPLLVSQQTFKLNEPNITTCHDVLDSDFQQNFLLPYFVTLFTSCFLLPFLVILYCHSAVLHTLLAEGKRYGHAVCVTVLVLLVFIMCLLPSNILLLIHYIKKSDDLYLPYMFTLAISTFNSCIDPFIFYYVSAEFREKTRSALSCSRDSRDKPSSLGTNASYSSSSSGLRSKVTLLSISRRQGTSEMV
ncbi:proteinase-activated receptor 4-like [Anabas testudineus]|uniref:G-protein coupled receptors family 1 profile domain-containing protein n=1 Tax=Anabas testudineus TaxID=64144 RepID=A0A3Q1IZZ9_ANATE|nr:proteinase-activated receptor 4-like [Anabas testudineus]